MSDAVATRRLLGILFAACGTSMVALLLAHPHGRVTGIAELVDFETRHRLANEIVHGGSIALLTLLLAAHVAFARLIGSVNLAVTAGVTAFGAGCVLMTMSLVLDGFVTPALATQLGASQAATLQHTIGEQIQLCATGIRILMPMALLAFATSALLWCGPLVRAGGICRLAGTLSGFVGAITGVLVLTVPADALSSALLGGVLLVALWQLALAAPLMKSEAPLPR